MSFIITGLILMGFVAGYFLATPILIFVSVVSLVVAIYLISVCKEMATLIAMAYTGGAIVTNLVMWITWYIVTEQTWLEVFVRNNILR